MYLFLVRCATLHDQRESMAMKNSALKTKLFLFVIHVQAQNNQSPGFQTGHAPKVEL